MRRSIIVLKYSEDNRYTLVYLSSILESYVASRRGVDYVVSRDPLSTVVRAVESYDRVIVMYSLMTPQIFSLIEELKGLRQIKLKYGDRVMLIAGGPHAAGDPRGTVCRLGFDIAVMREGELTLPKLLDEIVYGYLSQELEKVPNVAYRDSTGRVRETWFSVWREPHGSGPYSCRLNMSAPVEIMRGCSFACKYCQTPRIYRFRVRYRSICQVATQCRALYRRGVRTIRFLAPNGFGYGSPDGRTPAVDKIEKLLRTTYEYCERNVKLVLGAFPSEVRPDSVTRQVLEVVSKYVDNRRLAIGAQSGSDRLLRLIGRGHDSHCVYEAVDLAIEHGFTPVVDFIFGLPGETERDVEDTVKMMRELARRGCIIRGHTFMPLPGTPFEREPPGKIHPRYLEALREIAELGRLEGYWREQEDIARKIHEYITSSSLVV